MTNEIRAGSALIKERVKVSPEAIADFCAKRHIRKLSLFGSVLRDDFRADSDIDVLVEFDPEHIPSLFTLVSMEEEMSELAGGRKVDISTPLGLSRYFRDEVLEEAEVLYEQA